MPNAVLRAEGLATAVSSSELEMVVSRSRLTMCDAHALPGRSYDTTRAAQTCGRNMSGCNSGEGRWAGQIPSAALLVTSNTEISSAIQCHQVLSSDMLEM